MGLESIRSLMIVSLAFAIQVKMTFINFTTVIPKAMSACFHGSIEFNSRSICIKVKTLKIPMLCQTHDINNKRKVNVLTHKLPTCTVGLQAKVVLSSGWYCLPDTLVFGLYLSLVMDLTSTGYGHQSHSYKVNDKVLNIVSVC